MLLSFFVASSRSYQFPNASHSSCSLVIFVRDGWMCIMPVLQDPSQVTLEIVSGTSVLTCMFISCLWSVSFVSGPRQFHRNVISRACHFYAENLITHSAIQLSGAFFFILRWGRLIAQYKDSLKNKMQSAEHSPRQPTSNLSVPEKKNKEKEWV